MTPSQKPQDGEAVLAYTFEKTEPYPGLPRYTWAAVGPAGAVHIWAQMNSDDHTARWGDRYIGGVECHWPATIEKAHHPECWLLKGPCCHVESEIITQYIQSELQDWYSSKIAKRYSYD